MAMIEFVRNYTDHSTDRGYQFEFRCDHCANGYMSSYQTSMIGTAGGLLQAAGNLFGGLLGNAGNSTFEIQRAIGGPAHDRALQQAVAEVKEKFHRCQRCGRWVCAEICWNEGAAQCVGCTPKFEQEAISLRTQAQLQATQQQMQEKALATDYVSGIDMRPDAQVLLKPGSNAQQLPTTNSFLPSSWQTSPSALPAQPAPNAQWSSVSSGGTLLACAVCGTSLNGHKFCASCGSPAAPPSSKACKSCGHSSSAAARFCEECGGKLG